MSIENEVQVAVADQVILIECEFCGEEFPDDEVRNGQCGECRNGF